MADLVSLNGNHVPGVREANERAVRAAEELLEACRSGDIVGFCVGQLHFDHIASFRVVGAVGGYGMVGALEQAKMEIILVNRED